MDKENKEDNFLELLEQYLDEEEIELKKASDREELQKHELRNCKESIFTREDAITIGKYVNDYLGIPGDCSNLLHCGLKDLQCNYVMGVDNNFANKNPELVQQGYLLLVIDSHNNRGTYVNPFYLQKIINKDEKEKELKLFSKMILKDLKKLKEYYRKYMNLREEIEMNDRFYQVLKEANKIKQLEKICNK